MGIGIVIAGLLAGATPVAQPRIVVVPPDAEPMLRRARLIRRRLATRFAAPLLPPDLRRIAARLPVLIAGRAETSSATVDRPAPQPGLQVAALVATPPDWRLTNRPLRRSAMAIGVTVRVANEDGVLIPTVLAAGKGARAASRVLIGALDLN